MFSVESNAFREGERIPDRHTCIGKDLSPELHWKDVPSGTKSFALIVEDPDAPVGTFIHWVVYDIPGGSKGLSEGITKTSRLPDGTKQGITDFGRIGYWGPCPPRGHGRHRYYFILRALDVESLGIPEGARKGEVERAMKGHILGEARIMGTFSR